MHQFPDRQADDIAAGPIDSPHKKTAHALHDIGPGLVHGLRGRRIGGQDLFREIAELYPAADMAGKIETALPYPDVVTRDDGVRPAVQQREKGQRLGMILRFAKDAAIYGNT